MYKKQTRAAYVFLFPGLLLIILFIFVPVVLNFIYSFYRWSAFSISKEFIGFENYITLFKDEIIYVAIKNNIIFAVLSLIFQVFVAMVLAGMLEYKVIRRFQPFFRTAYFIPSLMSITVSGLLFQLIYSPRTGFINKILEILGIAAENIDLLGKSSTAIYAVTMVSQWQYTGYAVMLFLIAMQKVPEEYYEAAIMDGAGFVKRFIFVTVPLIKETIMVNMVITVIGAFKVFDEIYVMTQGGPGRASEVLGTYLFRSGFRNDVMGYASAIATLIFVITFMLSLLQIKLSDIKLSG